MSSSDSDYDEYSDEDSEELPEAKMYKIFAAVIRNKVRALKSLLTSPKWYNIRDDQGRFNLLETAILLANKKVFDYMVSIPNFPIDILNNGSPDEAVVMSLYDNPYFLYEVVRKGADIDKLSFQGKTALHIAFITSNSTLAHVLIERGVDVNACASSPLSPLQEAYNGRASMEIIPHLLMAGATPEVSIFEQCVLNKSPADIRDPLFFYTFDSYSKVTVKLLVVLQLAYQDAELFYEIMKCPIKVIVHFHMIYYFEAMLLMSADCLLLVLQNFAKLMSEAFATRNEEVSCFPNLKFLPFENIEMILDSDLRPYMISVISNLRNIYKFMPCVQSEVTILYCYLLSYGLRLHETDVQEVYKTFGYGNLFKIFLHMDIVIERPNNLYLRNILPFFVYWPKMDVDQFLEVTDLFCNYEELWPFFSDPRLTKLYPESDLRKRENPPEIPLLVELARNKCRKFLIDKYEINTSKEFLFALNLLGLSPGHKKILMYKTKLYY